MEKKENNQALPEGGDKNTATPPAGSPDKTKEQEKIAAYSPSSSKFPKEYRNIIRQIGDYCAHKVQVALKQYLRFNIEVFWRGMDSLVFADFIGHLPSSSCIHILQNQEFQHHSLLVQNLPTISSLVERVLGARIIEKPVIVEFTSVDNAIIARITNMILEEVQKSFHSIGPIIWRIHRQESNPMLASVLPDKENVVTLTFEIKGQLPSGLIQLCIATQDIVSYFEKYRKNQSVTMQSKPINSRFLQHLHKIPATISVQLGILELSLNDLNSLRVGDIVRLDRTLDSPVLVYVEDVEKYTAKLGRVGEFWACMIENGTGEKL
jgi:flagellar motor switch protein FliM